MASKHRLRPLLYYNLNTVCPEKVPEDILRYLKDFYHSNTHKNLLFTGELIKIMELLKENDINAFTYKGPVLAHIAYGNIGLREFGDIDIFIDKSDALKAKEVMLKNNYILDPPIEAEDHIYMKLESEYRFKNKNNNVKVEINWNFEGTFFSFPAQHYFLFNELEKTIISGFDINAPSNNIHILMLCIHCAKHDWRRLEWINDIAELVEKEKKVNWDIVLNNAEKLDIKRVLLITLDLASELFDLKLDDNILHCLNDDHNVKKISNNITEYIFFEKSLNIPEKFKLDLMKRGKIINGLKDCFNGIFLPSHPDFKDLPLPSNLFILYHFIRPFLLLIRYKMDPI